MRPVRTVRRRYRSDRERFDTGTLRELYGTADEYVARIDAVERGYLLESERDDLLERAATIDGLSAS